MSCLMVMKTSFFQFDIFFGNFFLEMLPTQKILRYLPQNDQKKPSGIYLGSIPTSIGRQKWSGDGQ